VQRRVVRLSNEQPRTIVMLERRGSAIMGSLAMLVAKCYSAGQGRGASVAICSQRQAVTKTMDGR
jgi:hypothetical protein